MLYATNVACKLLDRRNGRCLDYKNRKKRVSDCVKLDREEPRRARLAAGNLRLSPARRRRAASRMALSDLRGAARRSTKPGNRPAAGRSARTTPASSNIMWSSARSEARSGGGAAASDRHPPPSKRASAAAAVRRSGRNPEAHLPVAHQPPRGARLGARPARLDRRAAGARRAGRAVRPGATIPLEGARGPDRCGRETGRARRGWSDGELRCGGPEAALPRRIEAFLKRRAPRHHVARIAEFAAGRGRDAAARSRSAMRRRAGAAARRKAASG